MVKGRYSVARAAKITAGIAASLLAATILMFEVTLAPHFELPRETEEPDPPQEARYRDCFAARDAEIHEQAFATIDNPDVQREFIATQRDAAERDCRLEFPQRVERVRRPLRFNLIDLAWRWGD